MRRSFDKKFIRPFEMRYIVLTHIGIEFQNIAYFFLSKFCKHLNESQLIFLSHSVCEYIFCVKKLTQKRSLIVCRSDPPQRVN